MEKKDLLILFYVFVLVPACLSVCALEIYLVPAEAKTGHYFSEVIGSYELWGRGAGNNAGPLQEQQVLFTTEPSYHPSKYLIS